MSEPSKPFITHYPPEIDVLGRAAYEAYIEHAPENNFLPPWGVLDPEKREAWRAAADAVRRQLR